ncbi:hypothetical protein ZYGR_0C00220 [Zygosaccharomyces rouxii]|uniref:BRO domain-containing protein 1 n=1 Tax=Zygosaccharomyces rouxii TaxID=4956 RepID=A0A1Q2ZU20_ZYGRO|nr:hypothetical protein ZYGR_0C00220 [Zygosaccharomyces rouxii]
MKACLATLKLKDTEAIDWKKGLVSYLKRSYGSAQWSQFYNDKLAGELNHLRNNANGELALEALLEQNFIYYAFLEQLHLRIGNNSPQLRLHFTWYEAEYDSALKAQKHSQYNVILEKSCILYNIGALLTELAKEKVNKDYKASLTYLMNAVACFEYLSENFLNSPSLDLRADITKFLAELCHAQAQELFLLKLINGPDPTKQASLVSKLSYAAASLYETCHGFFEDEDEEVRDYGDIKWRSLVTCKMFFFKAVTAYYYAVALEQQNKYGEAIAFLNLAGDYLVSSLPYKISLKEFIDFTGFKEELEDKKRQVTRDNDFIYHDAIPQSVQLEVIKSMDAVKSTSFPGQLEPYVNMVAEKCDTLYQGIVPMEIYEKESIYSEEKARFLRNEIDVAETANWEYTSYMEFTNLPKFITDMEARYKTGSTSGSGNPQVDMMKDQLISWSRTVQDSKFNDVDEQMRKINEIRQKIMNTLSTIPPEQRENTVKLKSALLEASESDDKLFSLVKPFIPELKLLKNNEVLWATWGKFEVDNSNQPSLLDIDDTKTEAVLSKLGKLKQLCEDLRLLKEERGRSLSELKEEANNDDITKKILVNRGSTDSELKHMFEVELEKFKPFSARVEATVFKQSATICEMRAELDEVSKLSGVEDASGEEKLRIEERQRFFDKIQEAVANFAVFCADLPKGLAFYDSLLKISKGLASSAASQPVVQPLTGSATNSNADPRQVNLESQFKNLNLSSSIPATPMIPPRTYGSSFVRPTVETTPVFGNNSSLAPPVPPKEFGPRRSLQQEFEKEERELQQNPTSFYNRPSVFDENLYSKFSG